VCLRKGDDGSAVCVGWRKLSSYRELVQDNLGTGKANDPQFKMPCEVKTTQHRARDQPWKSTSEPDTLC